MPVVIAAKGMAPIVAHESDYTPGLANKITAKFADRVCVTFEDTLKYVGAKGVHTGTPYGPNFTAATGREGWTLPAFPAKSPYSLPWAAARAPRP